MALACWYKTAPAIKYNIGTYTHIINTPDYICIYTYRYIHTMCIDTCNLFYLHDLEATIIHTIYTGLTLHGTGACVFAIPTTKT